MANILLIDVVDQSITSATATTHQDIYDLIGNGCVSCNMYKLPSGDYLLYDMGQFYQPPIGGFSQSDLNWLLLGNGCVIGYDENSADILDAVSTPAQILGTITWYDQAYCEEAQK